MIKYQNTGFEAGRSTFINTASELPSQVTFTANRVQSKIGGKQIPFYRGSIALRNLVAADTCGSDCPTEVTNGVKLEFSVLHDDSSVTALAALKTEIDRLYAEALTLGLGRGLVPPVYSDFADE